MKELSIYKADYSISTRREQLDLAMIHDYLCHHAYWCPGIPFERVETAADHSLNFGVYQSGRQIGYARIITDFSSIAYLGDVFILPPWRGKGLSKWLMETIMKHPALQGLRRWILLTGDAHGLYSQYGWKAIASPYNWMELHDKNVYQAFIKTATSVSPSSPA